MLYRYAQRNAGGNPVAAARLALELGVTPVTAAVLLFCQTTWEDRLSEPWVPERVHNFISR